MNYRRVCQRLVEIIRERGGEVVFSAKVCGLRQSATGAVVQTPVGEFAAKAVVNCGGLHSDRITSMSGQPAAAKIVPFRGSTTS